MTPFERIGGGDAVRRLSDAFYDAIAADARFAELAALHGDMTQVRSDFAAWLSAWLGGPPLAPSPRGGCLMSRHRAMAFGLAPAQQWLAAMHSALDAQCDDAELRSAIHAAFTRMVAMMIGRPDGLVPDA